jgi:hypothetical protein
MIKLTEVELKQRIEARQKFIALAWGDKSDTGELLRLAKAAEISPTDADELLTAIAKAQEDRKIADTLDDLRDKHSKTLKVLEDVKTKQTPIIEAAQGAIEASARDVDIASHAVEVAEEAVDRLREVARKGNMPESEVPKEILAIREKESAEVERQEIHKRWVRAKDGFKKLKADIVEYEHRNHVNKHDWTAQVEYLKSKLPEAEAELKSAFDDACKAGFDVPVVK